MNGRTSTQSFCTMFLYIEDMACRFDFIYSDTELPGGR